MAPNITSGTIKHYKGIAISSNQYMQEYFNYVSNAVDVNSYNWQCPPSSGNLLTMSLFNRSLNLTHSLFPADTPTLKILTTNMTTTHNESMIIGRDETSYNTAVLQFNYNGLNSNTNTFGIGFNANQNLYQFSGRSAVFSLALNVTPTISISSAATSNAFTVFNSGLTAGQTIQSKYGLSDTTGNSALIQYTYQSSNSTSNSLFLGFTGGGGSNLTLPNDSNGNTILNTGNLSVINGGVSIPGDVIIRVGQGQSTGNVGEMVFHATGNNSTSNTVSLGFWGTRNLTIPNDVSGTTYLLGGNFSIVNSNSVAGWSTGLQYGKSTTNGNMGVTYFLYQGSNASNNSITTGFFGNTGSSFTIYNSTSTNMSINTGIESTARGAEYYLPSNFGLTPNNYTEVGGFSQFNSIGNNLLTYTDPHWINNTGRTIMVTFSYYFYIAGSSAITEGFLQKNNASTNTFAGTQVSGQDYTSGCAPIWLAPGQSISVIAFCSVGASPSVYGGLNTDGSSAKVTYVIHA